MRVAGTFFFFLGGVLECPLFLYELFDCILKGIAENTNDLLWRNYIDFVLA